MIKIKKCRKLPQIDEDTREIGENLQRFNKTEKKRGGSKGRIMNPTQHAPRCSACSNPISDRYIMRITEEFYHESCLLCCICSIRLAQTCYIRDQKFYCKYDYDRSITIIPRFNFR
ncbi:hypothetical protein PGB90_006275 [Kerria lacca]